MQMSAQAIPTNSNRKLKFLIWQILVFVATAWDFTSKLMHWPLQDRILNIPIFSIESLVLILAIVEIVSFITRRSWFHKAQTVYLASTALILLAVVGYIVIFLVLLSGFHD